MKNMNDYWDYYYNGITTTRYPGDEPGPIEYKVYKNRDSISDVNFNIAQDYAINGAIATAKLTEDLNKMKPKNNVPLDSLAEIAAKVKQLSQNPCYEIPLAKLGGNSGDPSVAERESYMHKYLNHDPFYGINSYDNEHYVQPSPKSYMKAVEAMETEYKKIQEEKKAASQPVKPKEINTVQQAVQGVSEEVAAWTLAQALTKQAETLVGIDAIPFVKLTPTLLAKLRENLLEKLKEIENSDSSNKEGQQARLIAFHKATIALLDR
jgi:hypothetical protein